MKKIFYLFLLLAVISFACTVEWVENSPLPTPEAEMPTGTAETLEVLPTPTPAASQENVILPALANTEVTVMYDMVNLRNENRSSTGDTVSEGELLAVCWQEDGYGKIMEGQYKDLYIWRGCTSDPLDYSCLSGDQ